MGAELLPENCPFLTGPWKGPCFHWGSIREELFGWGWWSIRKDQWEPADGPAAFLVGD